MSEFDPLEGSAGAFWPAVSDLMLAIVLILCMMIAAVSVSSFPIEDIQRAQREVAIDSAFEAAGYQLAGGASEKLTTENGDSVKWLREGNGLKAPVFTFEVTDAEPYLQRITFAESVLFPSDQAVLLPEGRTVLETLASVVRPRVDRLEQIQIHGHADNRPSKSAKDNLELASLRANAVFRFLSAEVAERARLDPVAGPLMSATSFGANAPVGRAKKTAYSLDQLCADNGVDLDATTNGCSAVTRSTAEMDLNRRVEVWLYYRAGK